MPNDPVESQERGRAEEIFLSALEVSAEERPAFLESACGGSKELRAEVEALLAAHASGRMPEELDAGSAAALLEALAESEGWALPSQPPERWGHLENLEELGSGGFGTVYRAWDPALQRAVALKLRKAGPTPQEGGGRRYIEEARRLASLRHPNVVAVYGVDEHDGRVGFWTELIDGSTLADIVREQGPLGMEEAVAVGRAICRALAAAHGVGLVHGDVKPSNVMRERGGRIVLMDFGAASVLREGSADEETRLLQGTPSTLAPELLERAAPTQASDIYSLGVLLYFLVTGDYPVRADSLREAEERHRSGDLAPLLDRRADLPDAFVEVVERAMAASPENRFASPGEMERTLGRSGASIRDPEVATPARQRAKHSFRPLATAAAAVLAIAALGWWRGWFDPGSEHDPTAVVRDGIVGYWRDDNFGPTVFRQVGDEIWAVYTHDRGAMRLRRQGGRFIGVWCEDPTRRGPVDEGPIEIQLIRVGDMSLLDTRWRFRGEAPWHEDWDLTPISGEPPSALAARFAEPSHFCDPLPP